MFVRHRTVTEPELLRHATSMDLSSKSQIQFRSQLLHLYKADYGASVESISETTNDTVVRRIIVLLKCQSFRNEEINLGKVASRASDDQRDCLKVSKKKKSGATLTKALLPTREHKNDSKAPAVPELQLPFPTACDISD